MELIVETEAAGVVLNWHGYQVACETCEAADRLTLRSGTYSQWDRGESAVAVCPAGHEFQHPLVYPQVVGDAARHGPGSPRVPNWRPHLRFEQDYDLEGLANLQYVVDYLPWETTGHIGQGWWEEHWPELVAASETGPDWLRYQFIPYEIRVARGTPPSFLTDLPEPPERADHISPS